MERINEYQALLEVAVTKIGGEELSTLDFDGLKRLLSEMAEFLNEARAAYNGLMQLRQDYIARIAGMEKAIAVAGRAGDGPDRALELTAALPGLSAAGLISQYNKTQARFRDAFPTSFGILRTPSPGRGRQNLHDYK